MTPFGRHPIDAELRTYIEEVRNGLMEETQAERCDWNGVIRVHVVRDARGRPTPLGRAYPDGTMSLRTDLLDALRDMCQQPGVQPSGAALHQQQEAEHTVRHELIHFLVPRAQRFYQGLQPYRHFAGFALEEGSTEAAAQNHARIDANRVESRPAGATHAGKARTYPELTPALRELAAYVGRLRGESARTIIDALARETPLGKLDRLPRMVLEARGLWDRIPQQQRALCERALREAVWNELSLNRGWAQRDGDNRLRTGDPEARSKIMGLRITAEVERRRLAIEYAYGTPNRPEVPWQTIAAHHERALAEIAAKRAARSQAPDVRQAASEWVRSAAEQRAEAIETETAQWQFPNESALQAEAVARAAPGSPGAGRQPVLRTRAFPPYRWARPSRDPGDRSRER